MAANGGIVGAPSLTFFGAVLELLAGLVMSLGISTRQDQGGPLWAIIESLLDHSGISRGLLIMKRCFTMGRRYRHVSLLEGIVRTYCCHLTRQDKPWGMDPMNLRIP